MRRGKLIVILIGSVLFTQLLLALCGGYILCSHREVSLFITNYPINYYALIFS